MSYAQFEITSEEEGIDYISVARKIFERGNEALQRGGTPEERKVFYKPGKNLKKKMEMKIV